MRYNNMKCQYLIAGLDYDTFNAIHSAFKSHRIILSHQWNVSTQTYDVEISDKVLITIIDGNITLIYKEECYTIEHDSYIYIKIM